MAKNKDWYLGRNEARWGYLYNPPKDTKRQADYDSGWESVN